MTILIQEKLGDTTDEYIMEIEGLLEQIKIIAETATGIFPDSSNAYIRIDALNSAIITLCDYCNGVIQNYYSRKEIAK